MGIGIETERKFIVEIPDISALSKCDGYTVSRIQQTYLASERAITHRIRLREYADHIEYYETKKTRLSALSVIEEEKPITREQYDALLEQMARGTRTLIKTRHAVPIGELIYEFDVYPEWQKSCIMEVELPSEDTVVLLPDFVHVIEEVTGRREYTNASMARVFPEERI